MSQNQIDILERALAREKAARKQAEKILETKSTELYEAKRQLEKSYSDLQDLLNKTDSQLQGVFETIVDAYVVIDLWGNVLKMNNAALQLLGFDNLGDQFNLLKMVLPEETERVAKSFQLLLKTGAITDFHVNIKTRKKEKKIVHINASIIYDKGIPVAAQGIVRDITELRSLELQKERLLFQLEKSNNELQEYAHVVSHDLKSPLRSIDALVNWVKEDNKEKLDDISLQNIELIETTLEKMEQLISDVLTYSSLGVKTLQSEEVNLDSVLSDLIQIIYKPVHVKIEIINKLPTIKGDKTKLKQLFQNLISNAVKFIDKKQGLVQIRVKELKTHYQFSISDNGVGIEKKFYDKIFKIFHSLNKSKHSTGIGLSIVKKIVDIHEGEIWLESELQRGTTFYFTLKK